MSIKTLADAISILIFDTYRFIEDVRDRILVDKHVANRLENGHQAPPPPYQDYVMVDTVTIDPMLEYNSSVVAALERKPHTLHLRISLSFLDHSLNDATGCSSRWN